MSKASKPFPAKILTDVMLSGVWRDLPLTAQSVYAAHVVLADNKTLKNSWAVGNVANLLNLKPRTVEAANKVLVENGLITRAREGHHKAAVTTLLPCRHGRQKWSASEAHGGAPLNDGGKVSEAHGGALRGAPPLLFEAHSGAPNLTYKNLTDSILLINTPADAGRSGSPASPKRPQAGKKTGKNPSTIHQPVIDHFCARWQARYHRPYKFRQGRDAKHLQNIRKALGEDLSQCVSVIDRYIACSDPFILKLNHPLDQLDSQINRFTADAPKNGKGEFKETSNASSLILNA